MQLGFILSLLFAILITVFAIQNSDTVNINFLFANIPVSQALVIFISAAVGAIIVGILGFFRYFKLSKKIKEQKQEINELKEKSIEEKVDFKAETDTIINDESKVENEKEKNEIKE